GPDDDDADPLGNARAGYGDDHDPREHFRELDVSLVLRGEDDVLQAKLDREGEQEDGDDLRHRLVEGDPVVHRDPPMPHCRAVLSRTERRCRADAGGKAAGWRRAAGGGGGRRRVVAWRGGGWRAGVRGWLRGLGRCG